MYSACRKQCFAFIFAFHCIMCGTADKLRRFIVSKNLRSTFHALQSNIPYRLHRLSICSDSEIYTIYIYMYKSHQNWLKLNSGVGDTDQNKETHSKRPSSTADCANQMSEPNSPVVFFANKKVQNFGMNESQCCRLPDYICTTKMALSNNNNNDDNMKSCCVDKRTGAHLSVVYSNTLGHHQIMESPSHLSSKVAINNDDKK